MRINRYLRVKPGRYIKVGRLYLPITDDPLPYSRAEQRIAKIERMALCKDHDLPKRVSSFSRVWQQILRARKGIE